MTDFSLRAFDLALFQWLGAGSPDIVLLQWAASVTRWAPWICAIVAIGAVLRRPRLFWIVSGAFAACALSSPLAQFIAAELGSPRPFMLGLVPNHIGHGDRGGMPSTHATVMFTLAFMLVAQRATRAVGAVIALLAMATGWARVYLGIHFPLDVVAGGLLAALLAGAAARVPALSRAMIATSAGRARRSRASEMT